MIKVGITGGIGSGKSVVCEIFRKLRVSIYNADNRAKIITNEDTVIKNKLISKFGSDIIKNNQLDRVLLAEKIFKDKAALEYVNSIIHPAVRIDFQNWCKQHATEPYVMEEAALLFESGNDKEMNKMVTVYAPEALRIKRVSLRDGLTTDQIKNRINNQWPDEEKLKKSNFVIYNDEKQSVVEQVLKLHEIFKKLAVGS
jgi:dephospho-CoA kinase